MICLIYSKIANKIIYIINNNIYINIICKISNIKILFMIYNKISNKIDYSIYRI